MHSFSPELFIDQLEDLKKELNTLFPNSEPLLSKLENLNTLIQQEAEKDELTEQIDLFESILDVELFWSD